MIKAGNNLTVELLSDNHVKATKKLSLQYLLFNNFELYFKLKQISCYLLRLAQQSIKALPSDVVNRIMQNVLWSRDEECLLADVDIVSCRWLL